MHSTNILLGFGLGAQLTSAQQITPTPRPSSLSLVRRDGPPVASCPEQFGIAPMNCNDSACGGQSSTAGICKNNSGSGKPCQCKVATAGAPVPTNTKISKTNSAGSTIIGDYDLITIDQYKNLRQSQTVTLTQTTTDSNGKEAFATAVAVVAAGGVVWFLGTSADAAGAAILEPPGTPFSNKDDSACPNPRLKCQQCASVPGLDICVAPNGGCACDRDEKKCPTVPAKCDDKECEGKDGKCTKGDPSNCPCKKSCPTGDKQPQCDDDTGCRGKDGKCTVGDNDGCECKTKNCPEERYTPYCSFCGDKGSDGKCMGISSKGNLWKGCACLDPKKADVHPPAKPHTNNWNSLPKISPSSYSYAGDDPLVCQGLNLGAKKDDLRKSVTEWCKSVDGKKLTASGDTDVLYKRFGYSYYSYWLAAQYDGDSGGNCGSSEYVHEIDCVSTMLEALDDCTSGESEFKGAILTDGCVKYQITFSTSTNDNDPPFKPLKRKDVECSKEDSDITTVAFNFWEGVSQKFCKDVGDGKTAKKNDLTNKDLQKRSISRRTPPPSTGEYPDWKFHFEWKPTGTGVCSSTCKEAISSITGSCGHMGPQSNSMVKKGSMDVGCGTYSFELNGPPAKKATSLPNDGTNKQCVPSSPYPLGFNRKEALETIIPQFCSRGDVNSRLLGKDSKYPTLDYRSLVYPDMLVNIAIAWKADCKDTISTFVDKDRCQHLLGGIGVDACSVNQDDDKMGGTVDEGCLTYSIKGIHRKGDVAHGTCSIDITQYFDGKNYKVDGIIKDAKGGLLSQCKNEKAKINEVVICQTGNHGMLPMMVHLIQRDDGTLSVSYDKQDFRSTICKGHDSKYKDGKKSISCPFSC